MKLSGFITSVLLLCATGTSLYCTAQNRHKWSKEDYIRHSELMLEEALPLLKKKYTANAKQKLLEGLPQCTDKPERPVHEESLLMLSDIHHNRLNNVHIYIPDYKDANISNCGKYIYVTHTNGECTTWDARTGIELADNKIESDSKSPAGHNLVIRQSSRCLEDTASGIQYRLEGVYLPRATISPDGKYIYSNYHKSPGIIEIKTGKTIYPIQMNGIGKYCFTPDSKALFYTIGKHIFIEEFIHNEAIQAHTNNILDLKLSPCGNMAATASHDYTARLWDLRTMQPVGNTMEHTSSVRAIEFSPCGKFVATASADKSAVIWDAATGEPVSKTLRHEYPLNDLAYSPCGNYIATAGSGKGAIIWNIKQAEPAKVLVHKKGQYMINYSNNGKLLITASMDGTAQIWDAATGAKVHGPLKHNAEVSIAIFSPNGKLAATASSDGNIKVWDVKKGTLLHELAGHTDWILDMKFSPDSKMLLSGSKDKTAILWDLKRGKGAFGQFRFNSQAGGVSFNADGTKALIACWDGSIRLMDTKTGEMGQQTFKHKQRANDALFLKDGMNVISSSLDRTLRIWSLEPMDVLRKYRK